MWNPSAANEIGGQNDGRVLAAYYGEMPSPWLASPPSSAQDHLFSHLSQLRNSLRAPAHRLIPAADRPDMAAAVSSSSSISSIRSSTLGQPAASSALKSCPTVSFAPSNGSRIVCMATKRVSARPSSGKKSWLPGVRGGGNLVDPQWLDGSLPGDYGFDPLGLGKDPAALKWYREAEIIHGRWAMAAVVGILVGQAWSGIPWYEAGAAPGAVSPFSFGTLLGTQVLLMGWVESKRWVDFFDPGTQSLEWATPWSRTASNFGNSTGLQGYPGGKFFDPFAFAGELKNGQYIPNFSKLERLQLAEIKHARIAMLAMLLFYFEAAQGKTPLGAIGL